MTVRVYRWDDASAPTLNGTAGSLIAVLDACLVTGYGTKTASGWTKPYTGTNLAAFLMPTGSNLHYLRVDDTTATSASWRGYEVMTDVNTGTGPFPTVAQMAALYLTKSSTADTTARQWVLVCNGPTVLLHVNHDNGATSTSGAVYVFGSLTSYKTGDTYSTFISGNSSTAYSSNNFYVGSSYASSAAIANHYVVRSYTQVGASIGVNKGIDSYKAGSTNLGSGSLVYPSPVDGGLYMSPIYIGEPSPTVCVRGILPGAWAALHPQPLAHLDTLSGSGALSGKTFLALRLYSASQVLFETSDTW